MEKTLQAAITEARVNHLETEDGYYVVAEIDSEGAIVEHYVCHYLEESDEVMAYEVDEDGEEWFSAYAEREFPPEKERELNIADIWDSIPDDIKPYVL